MYPSAASGQWSAELDATVEEILGQSQVFSPPVDAIAISRRLGIVVATDDRLSGRARRVQLRPVRGPAQETIFLRPEPRPERQQWAVAHELGERWAQRVFNRMDLIPAEVAPAMREAVANQVADRLLAPTLWLSSIAGEVDWDLLKLKQRFATASHELLARRMLDFDPPVIVTVFDQANITWRRSNVDGQRIPPPDELEHRLREEAHRFGRTCEEETPAIRVRVWPIHEDRWRREIVRMELRGFY